MEYTTFNFNNDKKINLYKLLEVETNSTDDDIKKAWRKLALKYHPDKNKQNTCDKFLKIKYAYDILSNKELKKKYDEQLKFDSLFNENLNSEFTFSMIDLNFKKYLKNFINSTEIDKVINLILHKKEIRKNFFNINDGFYKNFDEFIKKLTDIEITIDFDLKDVWECKPKNITYNRYTKVVFEELIIPIDFIQEYENEGECVIVNNKTCDGSLTVKINIINNCYGGENYYIYDNDLYVIIDNKRIINDKFELNFLDGNKYKFNIKKLNKIVNKLGTVYYKKNMGLPKYINEWTNEKNNIEKKIFIEDIEKNIEYSNLFFIIVLY